MWSEHIYDQSLLHTGTPIGRPSMFSEVSKTKPCALEAFVPSHGEDIQSFT